MGVRLLGETNTFLIIEVLWGKSIRVKNAILIVIRYEVIPAIAPKTLKDLRKEGGSLNILKIEIVSFHF